MTHSSELENTEMAPRLKARIAGGLWLIVIATGVFALFVRSTLIVRGNAAATATNIIASESLFRLGFAADVISFSCYLALTVILYELMKPVGRSISLMAASFGLAGCVVGAVILVNLLVPMILLGGAPYLSAFEPGQLQALALTSLRLHGQAYDVTSVFFGLQCMLLGYLIARSTFLPRLLGLLLGIGGLAYIISAFASFVSPALGAQLFLLIVPAGFVGEGSLSLWLVVKGVNGARWEEQARAKGMMPVRSNLELQK